MHTPLCHQQRAPNYPKGPNANTIRTLDFNIGILAILVGDKYSLFEAFDPLGCEAKRFGGCSGLSNREGPSCPGVGSMEVTLTHRVHVLLFDTQSSYMIYFGLKLLSTWVLWGLSLRFMDTWTLWVPFSRLLSSLKGPCSGSMLVFMSV